MKHLRVLGTLTTSKLIASLKTLTLLTLVTAAALTAQATAAVPDPVLQWIGIMNTTVITGATNATADKQGSCFGVSVRFRCGEWHPSSLSITPCTF